MTPEMPTPPRTMSFTESTLSVLLRALPVKHGRHRLLDKIRNQPWPQATQLVRMNYRGHDLLMQSDDLVGWHFLILKTFDPEVAEVLCAAASGTADAVFWDIGANKGACSYAIASALPHCQIVLVEPQTSLTDLLKHNMALLAPERHEIYPVGLGTEPGEFKLAIPESNKGGASLVFDAQHSKLPTVTVRVETAQKVSESSRFGWPTLIKMDVEGFEPIVFQSLKPAIESRTCEAIVFENHASQKEAFATILGLVKPHGYRIFAVTKTVFSTRLTPCESLVKSATDYACLRDDIVGRVGLRDLIRE